MKIRRFFFLFAIICAICAVNVAAVSADDSTPLKIGLKWGSTAQSDCALRDSGEIQIGYYNSNLSFQLLYSTGLDGVTVHTSGNGFVVNSIAGNTTVYDGSDMTSLAIRGTSGTTTYGTTYSGGILLTRQGSAMNVINVVDMQNYLKGIVPTEMSSSWPIEALKAQAIAARNYAVKNRGKHSAYGFDLCADVDCQAYTGTSRMAANSNAAVDETNGIILTYNDAVADLFYHASSGGYTENSENVWLNAIPYLVSVTTPYENLTTANNGLWETTLTPDEVTAILQNKGYNIGTVVELYASQVNPSGNVYSITAVDNSGNAVTISKQKITSVFSGYIKSLHVTISKTDVNGTVTTSGTEAGGGGGTDNGFYIISASGTEKSTSAMSDAYILNDTSIFQVGNQSPYYVLTGSGTETIGAQSSAGGAQTGSPTATLAASFTISGKGWGHNVGMSQQSAKGMADNGWTYDRILLHFFPGTQLTNIN